MKFCTIISTTILLISISYSALSQTEDFDKRDRVQLYIEPLKVEEFDETILQDAILYEINNELSLHQKAALIPHDILIKAANDYAVFMSETEIYKPEQGGSKLSLQARLETYNGAFNGVDELTTKESVNNGKDFFTYEEVAKAIVFSWFNNTKYASVLQHEKYIFTGIAAKLGPNKKKVYIDLVLGNYNTLNLGVNRMADFPQPLNTSTMKLAPYDAKICKKTDRYKNAQELLQYLTVDDNNRIFFETNDWKNVGKLFKLPTDALAVDIVQWEQYPCLGENITDNSLFSKGIVTKPVYQKKFLKLNQFEGKEAKNNMKMLLGTIPADAKNYELNLIVIQDKHVCKNIFKGQKLEGEISQNNQCNIIGDTLNLFNKFGFQPSADTALLKFKVPFELGKAEFSKEDIQDLLDALNEPSYIPLKVKVTAFSSIEGEEETNTQLRENRAESILNAIKEIGNAKDLPTEIFTSDSWELFKTDIANTRFDGLLNKTKEEIREELKKPDVIKGLEDVISKHRFALVEMLVKYDISNNEKEQAFVLSKFHKALDSGDVVNALSIQKYIIPKVKSNKYSNLTIDKMEIPKDSVRFAGLQMNKLWLDYTARNKEVDTAFWYEVLRLDSLGSENDYIEYNKIFCEIKFTSFKSESEIDNIQTKIDALMTKSLSKSLMDGLNLELQIKSLISLNEELSVSDEESFINSKLDKIKNIIELDENDWQGALNLAKLFIKMKDYEYSMRILKPFVRKRNVEAELIFTFISLCSHTNYMHHTEVYETALKKAAKFDKDKICDYFDNGQLSFQFFENPNVKKFYCQTCEY